MKYKLEIEINLPRSKVIELFDNPDNMKHWQPGLVSFEPVSGIPGEVGAKSKIKFKMDKREIDMIETITSRNLPDEFSGTYEAKGIWNEIRNYFHEVDPDKTKWISENEFKGTNLMMKVMLFLMPGAFKKQSLTYMKNFKQFAEGKASTVN